MTKCLREMHHSSLHEPAASNRARSERLVAQCCLAAFLSFLTFTAHASSGTTEGIGSTASSTFQPIMDLSAALYAGALAKRLEWVVPWVVQYVRFVGQDSEAQQSSSIRQALQRLHSIQSCRVLLPSCSHFGPVASCLRCVLDDMNEDTAWLTALHTWEEAAQMLQPIWDARYLQLCCPLLEHGRQAIQVLFVSLHVLLISCLGN